MVILNQTALEVVGQLRRDALSAGRTFLLGNEGLPAGQAYHEFPDGRIAVGEYPGGLPPLAVVRWLTEDEARELRQRLDVAELPPSGVPYVNPLAEYIRQEVRAALENPKGRASWEARTLVALEKNWMTYDRDEQGRLIETWPATGEQYEVRYHEESGRVERLQALHDPADTYSGWQG